MNHYFPNLISDFAKVEDFRQSGKIEYSPETLLLLALSQRLSGIKSNNELEEALKSSSEIKSNLARILELPPDEMPSTDCLDYFFEFLSPSELGKVRRWMISALERKKFCKKLMSKDAYLLLAVDGVQTFSTKRKIAHSIQRDHKDADTTFHQYFLEAKIVTPDGLAISLDTEFIENPVSDFNKQDCELNAAKRLLERIRRQHPHFKFLLLGDALYCNSVIMDICVKFGWRHALTFKGEKQYARLFGEIEAELCTDKDQRKNRLCLPLGKKADAKRYVELRWCNKLKYQLGKGGERDINYLEGKVFEEKDGIKKQVGVFAYLLSEPVNKYNALRRFKTAKLRWKIENEGFNFQKNNVLNIKHSISSRGHAGQNYYLIAQIAHMIIQLAYFSDMAGHIRRSLTGETDALSQSLKTIFKSLSAVARHIRTELFYQVFRPPKLKNMRIRLKFA